MRKSDLVKNLSKEIEELGDGHLLEYKIVDIGGGRSNHLYSPTRKKGNGQKAKMNFKEFREFVLDERQRIDPKETCSMCVYTEGKIKFICPKHRM